MISVLVAAASPVVRAGLESLVQTSPNLTVAGRANGLQDLAQRVEEVQPDVILLEASSRSDDVAALGAGAAGSPPLVLLVDEGGMSYVRSGARGVLPTAASASEIIAAIEAVAAGLVVLHPDALEQTTPASTESVLTAREIDVLRLLAEGLANKEVAYRLGLSEHTVKFHVASLLGKLHAGSRTEAVTLGIRQGLIML